ncbi:MAG: hypothetical protein KAX51_13535, partial [Chromatiaceae bacterium]|nr:hypothetical protein [Chromatiaceae bacterium]
MLARGEQPTKPDADHKTSVSTTTTRRGFMSSRKELANAIRALSMDAVQKAKSGH